MSSHEDINNVVAPALPQAPDAYSRGYSDSLNSVLRLYFTRLDSLLRQLVARGKVSVKSYTAVSGAYTVVVTDYLVECTSGTFAVTLPSAVGIVGREFEVKNSGSGEITVTAAGGQTIDGGATKILVQYDAMKIMSNNVNWIIV